MKTTSCEPRRVRQPILPEDDCSRAVTSPHLLTSDKSCIGVYGSRTVICSGDVGSPIQAPVSGGRYELVGILTDTNVCESATNATLFVRIFDHINWIRDTITSDCTCRL
ncbi:anionic trypsin-2-like [Arctopsyche grandis]|uniref:anionic trypsin-2-like n=1 Tax=Arctopsyche grandis TaxID=121162 RepID=UPI00406D6B47